MCGFVGLFHIHQDEVRLSDLVSMTRTLRHRGPDDEGFLLTNTKTGKVFPCGPIDGLPLFFERDRPDLGLGHQRLSIIDLSEAGRQPMGNEDGSIWIVYNGEIYNYLEIRGELESLIHRFQSKTDTEVILHAYEAWGIDCLNRFNGMWSFAIVDLRQHRIFCSRDRAGVKPFYYYYDGNRFCFASEIKALLKMNSFSPEPNEQIVADYLFSGLLDHTQETFYKNIYQLRPGEFLLFESNQLTIKPYWDITPHEIHFQDHRDVVNHFYKLFQDAIRLRLRSDVPIGTCLSGGLDSSSIVCMANRLMFDGQAIDPNLVGEKQKTFSSCFENPNYDERHYIEPVLQATGAEKHYVFPQAEELLQDLQPLIWHQEEPFASTSIYAQWKVMGLAKKEGVKVLLDGQGGDELLAGYPSALTYFFINKLKKIDLLSCIKGIKGLMDKRFPLPRSMIGRNLIAGFLPYGIKPVLQKWMKGKAEWADKDFQKEYLRGFLKPKRFKDDLSNYLYSIFRFSSLPGLLHYEDRNSMAFSIETRLPFLDYRIIEYLFSLPSDDKIKDGVTKRILREAMKGLLPEAVRDRRDKMGFVTPETIWFRTLLKPFIEDLLDSRRFAERGYFHIPKLKEAFRAHCSGKVDLSSSLWRWINLELWFRTFIDKDSLQKR